MGNKNPSPLRYPGGKAQLFPLVRDIIVANRLNGATYIEPFAGGAGLALKLEPEPKFTTAHFGTSLKSKYKWPSAASFSNISCRYPVYTLPSSFVVFIKKFNSN